MPIVQVSACKCNQCGHIWIPTIDPGTIAHCAKCKSRRWNDDSEEVRYLVASDDKKFKMLWEKLKLLEEKLEADHDSLARSYNRVFGKELDEPTN